VPIEDDAKNTGAELIAWLQAHPLPSALARTPEELDEQIALEREAWD
jgi:hypothetical protein